MDSTRRSFLQQAFGVAVMAGGLSALTGACGGSTYSSSTPPPAPETPPQTGGNCAANGGAVTINDNHGHTAPTVTATDVGTAGHTHSFTLAAASFATLQGNTSVNLATNADDTGHDHSITVACV
ncbi:MAG: hypothetical protein HY804_02750 [Nitrospinae bacterium]|nr:hypothetical protein [Nitrospinota bacterium]